MRIAQFSIFAWCINQKRKKILRKKLKRDLKGEIVFGALHLLKYSKRTWIQEFLRQNFDYAKIIYILFPSTRNSVAAVFSATFEFATYIHSDI